MLRLAQMATKERGTNSYNKSWEVGHPHKKHAASYEGQAEFKSDGSLQDLQILKAHLSLQDMIARAEIIDV